MLEKRKLKVIIDFDDVLAFCNQLLLEFLGRATGKHYSLDSITGWGELGIPEDGRLRYLNDPAFYEAQKTYPGAASFLKELCEKAEVTIATSVYPEFMGARIKKIHDAFPFFPLSNVLMGHKKNLQADVMIDDNIDNLRGADVKCPVLFRQPWNRHVSGVVSVTNYKELLALIDTLNGEFESLTRVPKIVCLVGPSGSGKHEAAANLCADAKRFEKVKTYTTGKQKEYEQVGDQYFNSAVRTGVFFESSWYAGSRYGADIERVRTILRSGRNAVMVMDITGCMAIRAAFPGRCVIAYTERNTRDCVLNILNKRGLNREQVADRISIIDDERKHRVFADVVVEDGDVSGLREIVLG